MKTYHIKHPEAYPSLNAWATRKRRSVSYIHHVDYHPESNVIDLFFFDTGRGIWFYVTVPTERVPLHETAEVA